MDENWKPIEYKFVLLGDSSVGKTAIFTRISGRSFQDSSLSTIGTDKINVEFDKMVIEDKDKIYKRNFNVTLFDTAGQERYRAITKNYFKDSHGIILIYDITDRKSFEHIESWLNSIKETLSDWKRSGYMIMILGNKLDIVEKNENKREVITEEGVNICSENEVYWGGECSAKTFDLEKLKGIFNNFLKQVYIKVDLTNDKKIKGKKLVISKGNKKYRNCICLQTDIFI